MNDTPSLPAANGEHRGLGGRFGPGNRAGKGNPHARKVARLRSALLSAVTPEDLKQVVASLLEKAKAGDVPSIKELLMRLLGPPVDLELLERLQRLEQLIAETPETRLQRRMMG